MTIKPWSLLAGIVFLGGCASSGRLDSASLRQIHDDWISAYTNGNLESLRKFYDADSVIMPADRPTYQGWSNIREFFAPGFAAFNYQANAQIGRVTVSGDLGLVEGVVNVILTPKAGGAGRTASLRYLVAFRRDRSGTWRIFSDMDNRSSAAGN